VKEKPIELILDIPEDLPLIQADNIRIRQVLLNLVSNAAKFTEEGHIGVSARTIKRGDRTDIVIAVFDTGPGIHPSDQEKIFEPFSQVDASPTRKTGGTGLGLSICRHLVELHGGIIWVESVPGEGSTFAFTLPYNPPENPKASKQPLILGVHPDIEKLKLYRDAFEHNAFRFHNLSRPDHAIEVTRALKPDILLFDMLNASLDDWRLLSEVRSEPSLDSIKMFVTALDSNHDRGTDLGVRDVLSMPLRENAVREILSTGLGTDIQSCHLLVIVEQNQADSLRAFFENLGGLQVQVMSNPQVAEQSIREQDFDGLVLSLTLPPQTFGTLLEAAQDVSVKQEAAPVIGLLPDANHQSGLGRVAELARRRWQDSDLDKEQFFKRIIAFFRE
jgi:DNA-binding response OmpR family regulator